MGLLLPASASTVAIPNVVKPLERAPAVMRRRVSRRLRLQMMGVTTPSGPETVHEKLVALLRAEAVSFRLTHHDPVTTSAEAAAARGAELRSGAKAMLVKTRTGFVLTVLAADRRVDWKLLAPLVGGKGARFATDEELRGATGLSKGAVPPLGRVFGLRTIYDRSLLDVETVNFNAGTQTDSVTMDRADLIRIGGGEVAAFSTS
jgi:Ala-tRNA(Pro) deacylase